MAQPTPLDDVEFLARSPHRVEVLGRLREGTWSRPDLHEATGISQPTLGRVLGSLEERHWVERRGRDYALSAVGELVVGAFDELLDTVETAQRLGELGGLLPTDEMDFDLRRFEAVTVTTPEPGDVLRHARRGDALFDGASRLRILADSIMPDSLRAQHGRVVDAVDGDHELESVITTRALGRALQDPELVGLIRDLLESGRAPVYRYEGTIPMTLAMADATAVMIPNDEHGFPAALIESEDDVIRSWVETTIDGYRARSAPLTPADLPG